MASSLFCWALVAAGVSGVVTGGGPPPADDQLLLAGSGEEYQYPLQRLPQDAEALAALNQLWETYVLDKAAFGAQQQQQPQPITMDDVDRADVEMHPPLKYSVPDHFRLPPEAPAAGTSAVDFVDDDLRVVAAEVAAAASAEAAASATTTTTAQQQQQPAASTSGGMKGFFEWLHQLPHPHLPSLSALMPHLPSYIPGLSLEAEVHHDPVPLAAPHIPTPTEMLQHITKSVRDAVERLHHKQRQLVELVQCACPRPARCEGLLQNYFAKPVTTSPAPGPAASTGSGSSEPELSLFAGLTKPGGQSGPGIGFYVDKDGPHLGHYSHHHATASSSASSSGSALSSASAASQSSASASGPSQQASASGLASASAAGPSQQAYASSNSLASAGSLQGGAQASSNAEASVGKSIQLLD